MQCTVVSRRLLPAGCKSIDIRKIPLALLRLHSCDRLAARLVTWFVSWRQLLRHHVAVVMAPWRCTSHPGIGPPSSDPCVAHMKETEPYKLNCCTIIIYTNVLVPGVAMATCSTNGCRGMWTRGCHGNGCLATVAKTPPSREFLERRSRLPGNARKDDHSVSRISRNWFYLAGVTLADF